VSNLALVSASVRPGKEGPVIFSDVSITISPGEIVALVGRSGGGKSTLLRCLSGLLEPADGVAQVGGVKVSQPSTAVRLVLQNYNDAIFPWLSVEKNICLGVPRGEVDESYLRELISSLELDGLRRLLPRLSGGQRQRVQVARCMLPRPQFLLLDEAASSLDERTREILARMLVRVAQDQRTGIVFATHSLQEAHTLADRVLVINALQSTPIREFVRNSDRLADLRAAIDADA